MKKLSMFVFLLLLMVGATPKAHAWDVYVYNKTPHYLHYDIYRDGAFGGTALFCFGTINPGENTKCSTEWYILTCPTEARLWLRLLFDNIVPTLTTPNAKHCTNTRLEVTYDAEKKTMAAQWFVQY
jgi:hypothetical protein